MTITSSNLNRKYNFNGERPFSLIGISKHPWIELFSKLGVDRFRDFFVLYIFIMYRVLEAILLMPG